MMVWIVSIETLMLHDAYCYMSLPVVSAVVTTCHIVVVVQRRWSTGIGSIIRCSRVVSYAGSFNMQRQNYNKK